MAITLVASVTGSWGATGGTTAAIDTTGADLIVVGVAAYQTSSITVTDNKGNTYTPLSLWLHTDSVQRFSYCLAPTVGTGHTITVSGSAFYPGVVVLAFAGVASYHSQSGVIAGGGPNTVASGSVTPSEDGALIVTGLAGNGANTDSVAPAGFTVITRAFTGGVNMQESAAYYVQPTAAAINPTWSWSATNSHALATAVFLPAAPALVTVPDVVGETEAAADTLLVAAGLVTGTVTPAPHATIPAGQVISQSPASGASVAPGSAVNLVISTGPAGPPVYEVSIGETLVVPILATFRIQETIDAPDTMIADVFTVGTPFTRFSLGDAVVVTEDGVRVFGGVVTGTREQGLTGPSATDLVVEIQASSYELNASRRVITAAISQDGAETIGAAFATLVTDYYAEVDVTLHPSQAAGPALPAATFTRSHGDAVNKQLASSVGYLQSIDFENRLRAWAPGDVLAPDNYDEAVNPELLTGDITVERHLQNGYANRIILVGDPIPVPGHVDHFTGDGTTDTWPVTYVVNGPYPYFVDGAVAQGVIQYPATSTTEAIGGVEAPVGFQWEYDPIALTIHRRLGPVAAGVAFDFPYDGLFLPAGTAEDAGEIAAYGLWEHVENVTAVITDASAADYAAALLAAKIASKDEIVRLQTRALGFHPGQTMTIASFSRELSGDYLITQVDTGSESGGILLVRSITASKSQNNTHDWRRVYQQWAGASAKTE